MFPFQSSSYPNWLNLNEHIQHTNMSINSVDAGDYSNSTSMEMRKSTEVSKSHKEAERRRRQRINAHLSTLRSLLPNTTKTDKASLLAEVVRHVKNLRRDICRNNSNEPELGLEPWQFPTEFDEATLSFCDDEGKLMKVIVCCADRPGLVMDLAQAIRSVPARVVRAEMATVGTRTKSVVVLKWTGGVCGEEENIAALKRVLKAVVDNRISDPRVTQLARANNPINLEHYLHLGSVARWRRICSKTATLKSPLEQGGSSSVFFPIFARFLQSGPRSFLKSKGEANFGVSLPRKRLKASRHCKSLRPCNGITGSAEKCVVTSNNDLNLFDEMKQRFLKFKRNEYLEEQKHFQALAQAQSPKFMVIACADSRVCPSNILKFQPGEAFTIRNVANIVPQLKFNLPNGSTEIGAALEFAVNTLNVENILVIGHSSCGGIQTLMSMEEDVASSYIHDWVFNAKLAKLKTLAATKHLSFDRQCRFCEKESICDSLKNLLSYPWIKDRVRKGSLSLHGGYYDISDCTFEKWTVDIMDETDRYSIRDRSLWC